MGRGKRRSNNYGEASYWDARYSSPSPDGGKFFDWYQKYPALRPLIRAHIPTSSRILILGCGNSLLSEDMVNDGYEAVVNVDISSVVIEQMREKHVDIPQLTYFQMDAVDMSFFCNETFDCVLDKGTLDAFMCADDAPDGASKMLAEVTRLLRPDGIYMLITYGAPKDRVPLLYQTGCRRKMKLHIMSSPWYQSKWKKKNNVPPPQHIMEEVALTVDGQLPPDYVLKDPESHFIYVCQKSDAANGANCIVANEGETIASK